MFLCCNKYIKNFWTKNVKNEIEGNKCCNDSGQKMPEHFPPYAYPYPEPDAKDKDPFFYSDRSKEFCDPFSELNLFLSKRITKEIQENNSIRKWSKKIEANLLAKILPEFRERFPTLRLRPSNLKRIWEQLSYYYERIYKPRKVVPNKEALTLHFMIRKNLQHVTSPTVFPPYLLAQQAAEKIREYFATMQGECLKLKPLTKIIWAVQRHLLRDLPAINAKMPYEEYDVQDKLIVKLLLEISAQREGVAYDFLKKEIIKNFHSYEKIALLCQQGKLFSTVSMVLATKLYPILWFFSSEKRKPIEKFIRYQIELSKNNSILIKDAHRIELIQRILALYSIAQELPSHLQESILRKSIRTIRNGKKEHFSSLNKVDQVLFVFFNAEMHLINDSKSFDDPAKLEDVLLKSYYIAIQLPRITFKQMDQFELYIWKIIEEEGSLLAHIDPQIRYIIEKEIGNVLIDNPLQSLRIVVSTTVQFFKKIQNFDLSSQYIKEKIKAWVVQGDMLIRWVHFDDKTPLLIFLQNLWNKNRLDKTPVNHKKFIEHALNYSLKKYPLFRPFKQSLLHRLWILYKYLWYATFTNDNQSTYERFLMWHHISLKNSYPNCSEDKIQELLQHLSHRLIPLMPFEKVDGTKSYT